MSIYAILILFSIGFIIIVIDLVRRRKLKEQYSILWIIVGAVLIIFSFNISLVETLSKWLDVFYPPALIFLVGMIFNFVLILHLTVVVSKLFDQVLKLTQEIALLKVGKEKRHD